MKTQGSAMKSPAALALVAAICFAQSASAAPPIWAATQVDQSWRDAPARMIIEEVSRQAGLRPLLDDRTALRLDAARVTLLARNQPVATLLRRIGELTDTDLVIMGDRLVAYEHGRVPAMLIVANELTSADQSDSVTADAGEYRRDCEWIDLTVSAIAAEMSKAFGMPVAVTGEIRDRQELVSFSASKATLQQAVDEVCRQLDCSFGWVEGAVVIGQNGPAVPKHTAPALQGVRKKSAAPLRLGGDVLTWQELAHLTVTGCGRDVILPDAHRGRSVGKLWADGDALDILTARAMWSPARLSVEVTADSLALQAAGEEDSDEP